MLVQGNLILRLWIVGTMMFFAAAIVSANSTSKQLSGSRIPAQISSKISFNN
tara:strand:- start:177 stop:332 length:156 start_codon:yes stop_codon:yes gene_type:complete